MRSIRYRIGARTTWQVQLAMCLRMARFFPVALILWPAISLAQDCTADSLRHELLQRNELDQEGRARLMANPGSEDALEDVLRIDRENTAYMRSLLAACGWPRRSEVGEQAARAAWRLTQHADMDPQYQVLASQQLKWAVLSDEADARDLAVLVDRNRRLNDQPQVYGMQFARGPEGVIRFYDIVNPGYLDARRKEIGLVSFYCWALQAAKSNGGAALEWPAGVLFSPQDCAESP